MSSRLLSIAAAVFMVVSYPVLGYASYTSTIFAASATMTGDAASDALFIDQAGGMFRHNRFAAGDPGFNSAYDFDSTAPGDQTLLATIGLININAGAGADEISLGDGIAIRGAIDGGPDIDTLYYSAYTTTVRVNLGIGTSGLSATLGADQEVPPTTHAGSATATFTNYIVFPRSFNLSVTVSDLLPGDVTGLHLHQAVAGLNGPIITDLTGVAPLVAAGTGFTFTAAGLTVPLGAEAAFLGGGTYVDIHTAAFPEGAIRGQIFSVGNLNLSSGVGTGTNGISNVENVAGGSAADSLVGSFGVNAIAGAGGNDWIVGGPGNDSQYGEAGNDVLVWSNGDGTDLNEGGADADVVNVNGNVTNADVFLVDANVDRLRLARTNVGTFTLDNGTVEALVVNGIGGDDTFNLSDLAGVASVTTLNFNGLAGNDVFNPSPSAATVNVNTLGGVGTDILNMSAFTAAVRVNLGLGTSGLAATLGNDQEVPPTTHAGTGTATITNYSVASRTFDITVAVSDFPPADVTGFHIHQSVVGANGPVIVDFAGVAPLVSVGTGFIFTAAGLTLPPGSEAAFLGGSTYVNIHTAAFPDGAIRGQIFSGGNVSLAGGVATGINGVFGIENVTGGSGADSLVGSFAANVITGGAGNDWILGGPGADTQSGEAGNDALVWSNGDGSDVNDGGADTDGVNVNGNTINGDVFVVQPNGSRLRFDRTSAGPFSLDIGTVEVLIVNGIGGDDTFNVGDLASVASLSIVNLNGLAGNDVFGLSPSTATVNANTTGGTGTDTLNMSAFTSAVRVNLGLGTSGLSATLGNDQENPPTTHAGTGTATITNYNIANRTFNITVAVSDLPPGDVTGFHIHQAAVGVNGPIIVDFTGVAPLVPAGTGFTFTATGLSLPSGSEAAFLGGGTYVNIHTAAFPGGAIRGQVFSGGNLNLTSGVATGTSSVVGVENITGGTAPDSLVGSFAANVIAGGNGDDWIVGGPGADTQSGDAGNDVFVWSNGDGSDVNEGGADSDTVQVNGNVANADVFVVAPFGPRLRFDRTNVGLFNLDIGTVETLTVNGIGGDDTFNMNDLAGVASLSTVNFNGLAGNDLFNLTPASAGAVSLNVQGGTGVDTMQGPDATSIWNLTVPNQGNIIGLVSLFRFIEVLSGGSAADLFNVKAFVTGTPSVNGGAGTDTLNYDAESRAVAGDLTPPDGVIDSPGVQSLTFTQIETVSTANPQPTVSISDVTVTEGIPPTNAVFNVSLSQASLLTVTVNAATGNGTAIAPDDYTAVSGPVTFAPGEILKTVSVPITVDAIVETTETFVVNLSAPVNVAISDGLGVGTILENAPPTISPIANLAVNANTATGAIAFTVNDIETAAASLIVSATSSNTTLVPNSNIALGGSGSSRTVTVTPAFNQVGTTTITVTVSDGARTTSTTFVLTVNNPTTPQPPAALFAASIVGNSVTFRWNKPIGPAPTGYVVEGGINPGEVLASLATGSTDPIFTTSAPTGAFYVRVHTLVGGVRSAASNEIRIFVNMPVAPSAPTDLVATVNGSSLTVAWRNTFTGGSPDNQVLDVLGPTSTSIPLGATQTATFPVVPAGTYNLAVRSTNASGSSGASNSITIGVPAPCSGAPLPPSNFLAYRVGNQVSVIWELSSLGPAPSSFVVNVTGSFNLALPTTARSASGTVPPGTYNLSVSAVNSCGASAQTPVQTVVVP